MRGVNQRIIALLVIIGMVAMSGLAVVVAAVQSGGGW
jgi:hypothetical protein